MISISEMQDEMYSVSVWTHIPRSNLVYVSTNDDLQDLIIPICGNSFVPGRQDLETRNAHMFYISLSKVSADGRSYIHYISISMHTHGLCLFLCSCYRPILHILNYINLLTWGKHVIVPVPMKQQ